ncbi:MAG: hypothetical protein FK734_01135 [Asgard group archaeon]|nr:hypothetical protein [Asgard group archaeon]
MKIKLILNTPDLSIGGNSPKRTIDLAPADYKGKSVKDVITKNAFSNILADQDEETISQVMQMMFNFIIPTNIDNIDDWWQQPFESLIKKGTNEVIVDLEFSKEGIAFISSTMTHL